MSVLNYPVGNVTEEFVCEPRCSWYDNINMYLTGIGHTVVQLVDALRYKSEGRGFDSRCCHWNFSLTILPASL